MKTKFLSCLFAAAAAAMMLACGCEAREDDAEYMISISPAGGRLRSGASRVFTASGGVNYRWSLSDNSLGYLSASTGKSVRYTATDKSGTQTITVEGNLYSVYGEYQVDENTTTATATVLQGE